MRRAARRAGRLVAGAYTGYTAYQAARQRIKNKPKRPFSTTTTKTKRRKVEAPIVAKGGEISKSRYSLKYKVMKGLPTVRKTTVKDTYRGILSDGATSAIGKQGAFVTQPSLRPEDLYVVYDQSLKTNTSTVTLGQIQVNDRTRSFYLENYNSLMTLTNQGPSTIKVDVYDLMHKVDIARTGSLPTDALSIWNKGLQWEAGIDPVDEVATYPGAKPTDSKLFNQNFKVLKKTSLEMQSGANHEHHFNFNYNGKIAFAKMADYKNFDDNAFKGITISRLIVFRGMPADDSNLPQNGVVTLDKTKLIMVETRSYTTRISSIKGNHLQYADALPDDQAVAHLYNQNPHSRGIVDSVANAVLDAIAFS